MEQEVGTREVCGPWMVRGDCTLCVCCAGVSISPSVPRTTASWWGEDYYRSSGGGLLPSVVYGIVVQDFTGGRTAGAVLDQQRGCESFGSCLEDDSGGWLGKSISQGSDRRSQFHASARCAGVQHFEYQGGKNLDSEGVEVDG